MIVNKTLVVYHVDGHVTKFRNVSFATLYDDGSAHIAWTDVDNSEHMTRVENVTGFALED